MAQLYAESFALALRAARGTPIAAPTHIVNAAGTIVPVATRKQAIENRAQLAKNYRSRQTRRNSTWSVAGDLDLWILPVWCRMALKGAVTTPSTPTGAVLTRLWQFNPSMTADDLDAADIWWGDPGTAQFTAGRAMAEELKIMGAPSGDSLATVSVKGIAQAETEVGTPATLPAQISGPLVTPANLDLYIDSTLAIGTTAVAGRLLSVEHTFPTMVQPRYRDVGRGAVPTWTTTGRLQRFSSLKLIFSFDDDAQYLFWKNQTTAKVRVDLNGDFIEASTVGPDPPFYNRFRHDIYGPFTALTWGDDNGTRTLDMTIESEYNAAAGFDWTASVFNTRTTL